MNEELHTALELLARGVDIVRRCDAEIAQEHPTTDEEWDAWLADAEEFLEDLKAIGPGNVR